jgi:hypothetical protein
MINPKDQISDLEADILLLFYMFSDQHGRVNVSAARRWAWERLGVTIKDEPFTITQEHVDVLCEMKMLPSVLPLLNKLKNEPPDKR